jgi:hypothetical protein
MFPAGLPARSFGVAEGPIVSSWVAILICPWLSLITSSRVAELNAGPPRTTVFVSTSIIVGTFEVSTDLVGVGAAKSNEFTSVSSQPVAVGSAGLSRWPQDFGSIRQESSPSSSVEGVSDASAPTRSIGKLAVAFAGMAFSSKG